MKVCVIGLGYIGLPTAALVASKEINVHGVDINEYAVKTVNSGRIHIIEPDLEGLVKYDIENGYLKARTYVEEADVFVIAVPTPFKKLDNIGNDDGKEIPSPDISFVESAIRSIIPVLKKGNLVIIESTSPVGTTERMFEIIKNQLDSRIKVHIAYCPERVLPGQVIYELEHNDRVIGGIDEISTEKACDFYSLFVKGELHQTNARTAEMCKLTENAYRDVNIAFANELSFICDKQGINVYDLINFTNKHPRVNILIPGCGVGGHCIAVDPWFIVSENPNEANIIYQARKINDYKPEFVLEKIRYSVKEWKAKNGQVNIEQNQVLVQIPDFKEPVIACMGLAFKPNIDDLRESPALYITKTLIQEGYEVMPVEPNLKSHKELSIYDYKYAIENADIIVFLVNHREFKNIKIKKEKKLINFCR